MSAIDSDCGEEVITIQDAVNEKLKQEEDAIAVLGAGDENNCSYDLGYVERQALFSCETCDPLHENLAGVCFGCSLHCHEGHDLIELYTKRNFRCDCGNSKFGDLTCSLEKEKDEINQKNKYNHNFHGKYCTCGRPYPDPEDEVEDEMIQCILCEDWLHSRHLGCLAPAEYSEMICDQCVKKNTFLQFYKDFSVTPSATVIKNNDTNDNVDVESAVDSKVITPTNNTENCKLEILKQKYKAVEEEDLKALFMDDSWRNMLCQCPKCLCIYEEKEIGFIITDTDTISFYEKRGKENVEKVWEEAANSISQMNRVQQVELMQGYNDLKSGLQEFLGSFKENQVVRKEDVEGFFEELNKRKRRRLDDGEGVPPNVCKY